MQGVRGACFMHILKIGFQASVVFRGRTKQKSLGSVVQIHMCTNPSEWIHAGHKVSGFNQQWGWRTHENFVRVSCEALSLPVSNIFVTIAVDMHFRCAIYTRNRMRN